MESSAEFLTDWSALSSTGLVGESFDLLKGLGEWAGAVSALIGLVA